MIEVAKAWYIDKNNVCCLLKSGFRIVIEAVDIPTMILSPQIKTSKTHLTLAVVDGYDGTLRKVGSCVLPGIIFGNKPNNINATVGMINRNF
jgi:hypothetical protein